MGGGKNATDPGDEAARGAQPTAREAAHSPAISQSGRWRRSGSSICRKTRQREIERI